MKTYKTGAKSIMFGTPQKDNQPPRWAISKGNAGNNDLVSSGSPAAILVRHQAASSNCKMIRKIIVTISNWKLYCCRLIGC